MIRLQVPCMTLALLLAACEVPVSSQETPSVRPEGQALATLLSSAIERGVPRFNRGDIDGCADIYAIAVEAVVLGQQWGLSADERLMLTQGAAEAAAMSDASKRAWAYRRLMDALLMPRMNLLQAPPEEMVVFGFDSDTETRPWRVVVDGVMGGLSTGTVQWSNGALVFRGDTSLANNGGFSSIRVPVRQGTLAGYDMMRIRVRGDGRTYILGARARSGMGGDSFWHRFETKPGEWITVEVPVADLERHFFGERIGGRIDASQIAGLEFYIYDKKAGPFQLEVDSIEVLRAPRVEQAEDGLVERLGCRQMDSAFILASFCSSVPMPAELIVKRCELQLTRTGAVATRNPLASPKMPTPARMLGSSLT